MCIYFPGGKVSTEYIAGPGMTGQGLSKAGERRNPRRKVVESHVHE
jgi:hypothetical protein